MIICSLENIRSCDLSGLAEEDLLSILCRLLKAARDVGLLVPSTRTATLPIAMQRALIQHYASVESNEFAKRFDYQIQVDIEDAAELDRLCTSTDLANTQKLERDAAVEQLVSLIPALTRSELETLAEYVGIEGRLTNSDLRRHLSQIDASIFSNAFKTTCSDRFVEPKNLNECFCLNDLESFVYGLESLNHESAIRRFFRRLNFPLDPNARVPHPFMFEGAIPLDVAIQTMREILSN